METIKVELNCPKEITEVGLAIKQILDTTAIAIKDGFQPGSDIPIIMSSAFGALVTAIGGIQNLPEEFSYMPVMAALGVLIPVAEGIQSLINKEV